VLFGRDAQRQVLSALIDGARASHSGVLVVRGEPGVGKSALLQELVDRPQGMRVLRAVGVQAESELAFAGVHQIVWPLLPMLKRIPTRQAAALRAAVGLDDGSLGEDRFLIGAAVLSLLAAAAEEEPLLCIVDDAHWLDDASLDALTFAARRLVAERVVVVFAGRAGDGRAFAARGLPVMDLQGLDPGAAGALLAGRAGPALSADVRTRLVEMTSGNPLALLELPAVLSDGQLSGREPIGDRLPLTGTLETVFLERTRTLERAGQLLLLLAAADDTSDPAVVLRAAAELGVSSAVIEAVEQTGLLRITENEVQFRHPLVRSAVYQGAGFADRQLVHRVLGDTLSGDRYADRRVWHRAAATVGTDDALAEELERSAQRARDRGGHAAAAAALERAAAFTTSEDRHAEFLVGAAWSAWLGGRALATTPLIRADLDHLRAVVELQGGSPSRAHEILMAAAADILSVDPHKAGQLLVQAGEAANFAGDLAGEIRAGRRAERLRADLGLNQQELTMMAGVANLLDGQPAAGAQLLAEAISQTDASEHPRRFSWAGSCYYYLGEIADAVRCWRRFAEETRDQGAIALLAIALAYQAAGETTEGRFSSARVTAAEGLRLARETGQDNCAAFHLSLMARCAAAAGDEEECRAHAADVYRVARERGLGIHAANVTLALGELELANGHAAASLPHLETLLAAGPGEGSISIKLIGIPDLVEAAVRAGQPEQAHDALEFYETWTTGTGSRFELPLLSRCRALLSTGATAAQHFEDALQLHSRVDRPFERARTMLLYGEMLRRSRQPKHARDHLRSALELFDQLGAAPWAERARSELRASGETLRKRDPSLIDRLTPQELQIARAVSLGAPTKQVAAQLFLSPRTIEFHLRHIFTKLGITSRAQLAGFQLGTPA
jgi:DNA-binding CsgD family transcriptional regulator